MDEDLSIRKPVRLRQLHKPGNEYAEFNIHSAPLTSVPRCMTAPFTKKRTFPPPEANKILVVFT